METIRSHWKMILIEGILFVLLGFLAVVRPVFSTLTFELFIGWLLLFGGIFSIYRILTAQEIPGFWPSLIAAIISVIVGILLIAYPLKGILTLTILMAVYFLVDGVAKLAFSLEWRPLQNWGWLFISGLLSLGIAAIIYSGWPGTAVWTLGLLLGINLLFYGWTLILLALNAKEITQK